MNTRSSLWPSDIESKRVRAPSVILREQGTILGELTKNLVQAEVQGDASGPDHFRYSFYLLSRVLSYKYELFWITHDIGLYPVQIWAEDSILEDVTIPLSRDEGGYWFLEASDEKGFEDVLREIFKAKKTYRIITALLSQADPDWDAKADWTLQNEKSASAEDSLPF